jgi:hypothetical protein
MKVENKTKNRVSEDSISCTEMEFLDINLTKDSSLLLHAIHSPFYWRIFRENHTILWFKKSLQKKSAKQEN